MPKRSQVVFFFLTMKVPGIQLNTEKEAGKSYAEVAKSYSQDDSSVRGTGKKEKGIRISCVVPHQTTKIMVTVLEVLKWKRH